MYSAEVERVLMAHPGVQDCAVIGLPDQKWGIWPDLPRSKIGKVVKPEIKARMLA